MSDLPPVFVAFELVTNSRQETQSVPVFVATERETTQTFVDKIRANLPHTEFLVVRCIPGVVA